MWYRMAVTQGFVPGKRFGWNKKQLKKDIRKSALSVRPPLGRPKSPCETEILRTHIQGQEQIFDSP